MGFTKKVKLGDIIRLEYGKSLNADHRILGDYPVYGSSGCIGVHNEYLVEGPGIIVGRKGSVGEIIFSKKNFFPIDTTYYISPKDSKYNIRFLYYFLKSQNLKRLQGDVGVPGLNRETVYSESVSFIDDQDLQNLIALVLSAYDDLIELNEKRIKILEEMAMRLYREWFVKFRFPGHEKVKLVDSGTEYGKVPEGWEVNKLSKIANIVRGCSYSSEEIDDNMGDYYLVNLKSFNRGGGFRFDGAKYYSGNINNDQILTTGDIVVAVTDMTNDRAVIARPARIPEIDWSITLSADVVKISSEILPNSFLYQLLSSHRFTETTKQKANGANVLHLKPSAILEFVALIPDVTLLKHFDSLCDPVFQKIDKLLRQNDVLTKIRDILIPQLVTGRRYIK